MALKSGFLLTTFNQFQANPFYIPWKHKKTSGFLMSSRDVAQKHWFKMGSTKYGWY